MNKEFIPYEEALALKELGFDKPCIYYVDKKDNGYIYNFELHPDEFIKQCSNLDINVITAPLYQQAFRWFREKGYLISVDSLTSIEHEFYIKWDADKSILSDQYSTYEEAELECLRKLIKIVKEKQV